jgi:hypothetical protein
MTYSLHGTAILFVTPLIPSARWDDKTGRSRANLCIRVTSILSVDVSGDSDERIVEGSTLTLGDAIADLTATIPFTTSAGCGASSYAALQESC